MHDEHASGVQLANLSPSIEELGLEARGFERIYPPINYAHAFPTGRAIRFCRSVDDTCVGIVKFSKRDAQAWRALMQDYYETKAERVRAMFDAPTPEPIPESLRCSGRVWVDEAFESDEMKAACAAWASHVGFAPNDEGGVLASGFGPIVQDVGNNPMRGGVQKLPDALASYLLEHGGEVRTGARVTKILMRAGRATGVRLHDGTEIRTSKLVAANLNPILLTRDLLSEDDLGAEVASKMRGVENMLAHDDYLACARSRPRVQLRCWCARNPLHSRDRRRPLLLRRDVR